MIEELRKIKSGKRDLRQFGILMACALGVLGGLFWWRGRGSYPYFLGFAAGFLFFGLAWPNALKAFHRAWMTFAIILGWLMTRLILGLFFFIVLTPARLAARLFGWDPLALAFRRGAPRSYWIVREARKPAAADYEKRY
jgi:hypothetical protein